MALAKAAMWHAPRGFGLNRHSLTHSTKEKVQERADIERKERVQMIFDSHYNNVQAKKNQTNQHCFTYKMVERGLKILLIWAQKSRLSNFTANYSC